MKRRRGSIYVLYTTKLAAVRGHSILEGHILGISLHAGLPHLTSLMINKAIEMATRICLVCICATD
jgi:hypothetical protein